MHSVTHQKLLVVKFLTALFEIALLAKTVSTFVFDKLQIFLKIPKTLLNMLSIWSREVHRFSSPRF